ncbi:MAG: hypothetical protein AAB394_03160 [Patescibacteria group bacterium]
MLAKKTTIDDLARMVARGFNNVESKMATKEQLENVEKRLDVRLTNVENKLDNIEKIILKQQGEHIKNLDKRITHLEEMFAVK